MPQTEALEVGANNALACRTPQDAIAPHISTVRALVKAHGEQQVIAQTYAIIERGMRLVGDKRRMSAEMSAHFADMVVTEYPLETLADIQVFIRGCIDGRWEDGEYYSSIDIPRIKGWFAKYLDKKAEAMEQRADRSEHELEQGFRGVLAMDGVAEVVNKIGAQRRKEREESDKAARMNHLRTHLPTMKDDELREAYKLYPAADERSLIMAEADSRGLVEKALDKIVNPPGVGTAQVPPQTQGQAASRPTH